ASVLDCSSGVPSYCPFSLLPRPPPRATLFPYTTLFRSTGGGGGGQGDGGAAGERGGAGGAAGDAGGRAGDGAATDAGISCGTTRSEEHTSELQSRFDLVCRLLLEKKKKIRQKEEDVKRV